MSVDWAGSELIQCPLRYGLCLDKGSFSSEMRRLKIKGPPPWISNAHSHATTHYFDDNDGSLIAIVCMDPGKDWTAVGTAGMLVHEAVHVWQTMADRMGETNPSREFEAYSIQQISLELLAIYFGKTGKDLR